MLQQAFQQQQEQTNRNGNVTESEVLETLYCVRTTITRILRTKWEGLSDEPGEEVSALRRLFSWLWRVLRALWDSRKLLHEASRFVVVL